MQDKLISNIENEKGLFNNKNINQEELEGRVK